MNQVLGAARPDEWTLPLFVHVFGAMLLVGGIATAAVAQFLGWRRTSTVDAQPLARMALRALLFVAVPAWIIMRIGAQWIYSEEGLDAAGVSLTWLDIGFVTAEGGGVLLLAATVLAGLGARRLARGGAEPSRLVQASTALVTIILVAYLVAVWAMTAKPT